MRMNMIPRGFLSEHRYFCTIFMQNACLLQHTEKKMPHEVEFSYLTRQWVGTDHPKSQKYYNMKNWPQGYATFLLPNSANDMLFK